MAYHHSQKLVSTSVKALGQVQYAVQRNMDTLHNTDIWSGKKKKFLNNTLHSTRSI